MTLIADIELGAAKAELAAAKAEVERLRAALVWYQERATSLADPKKQTANYLEAIYVELSLDGGRRACAALAPELLEKLDS